jgi:hypothetical protein
VGEHRVAVLPGDGVGSEVVARAPRALHRVAAAGQLTGPGRFAYYRYLSPARQRVYRRSDAITGVPLPRPELVGPEVAALADALAREARPDVEAAAQALHRALLAQLVIPPCRVRVLNARPHGRWGELQGLYEPAPRGQPPTITLWMRTARQRRVVAFRTFLRTLLHELCHHLDYERFRLAESFHTQGFYQRESSLFHQLVTGPASLAARPAPPAGHPRGRPRTPRPGMTRDVPSGQ